MDDKKRNEYLALINKIAELQRSKNNLQNEQRNNMERIPIIRAELILEIGMAKDEKGKPVYSNEQLREAKLTVELNKNEEYLNLRKKIRDTENKIAEILVSYNNLIDQKFLFMIDLGIPLDVENEKYPTIG